jgi:hypothetical protein
MRTMLRDLRALVRGRLYRAALDGHRPRDVGTTRLWCMRCDLAWPCDEYAEISGRLAGRS